MGQEVNHACAGKVPYASKGDALKRIKCQRGRIRKSVAGPLSAYRCVCGSWHIGSGRTRYV